VARQLNLQDQELQRVVQALQAAQEQVLELAQEQARVLGLAAELVQAEVQVLQERPAMVSLVEAEAQVEVMEPLALSELFGSGPLLEL
jgi:hypothetical protein